MIALTPAVRAALARVPRHGAVAGGVGALVASIAIVLVSPLSLAGGVRGQEGASLFAADLAVYRAAPPDIRSASLVAAAAAGYEDRAFFRRPRWIPPLSPSGLVRAVVRNLRGIPQGGSTIPQQLAKLYLRTGRRVGVLAKLEEAMFAIWLVRQAAPEEVAGLYLNLSAGTAMGTVRRPADGLHRLSLALFGLPLRRLSREDQLVLGASPRGVEWLRAHPAISSRRIAATREWLIAQNLWDASVRSYLDDFDVDSAAAFRFVEGWTERVASGEAATADLDLVAAIDRFREGLSETLQAQFPGTAVRAAFAALGSDGSVLARSGAESALMAVNYGSVAKLEALDLAVEAFGPAQVRDLMLPPGGCVRWTWSTKDLRRSHPSRYCPTDVAPATRPMALDEAVARSINSLTARHAMLLPPLLARRRPDLLRRMTAELSAGERAALDSPADRALAGDLLAQLGEAMPPDAIAPELSYSAAGVALFRYLRDRRERAGLPADRLPEDPTSLLGNSSRATAEQIGAYLHRKLFANDGTCALSDTGALLALRRREGTLRWLAQRWPKLVFSGKTGSSPHDDSAVAAVGLCLDARPVVLVSALRPLQAPLPDGLQGSLLLRGIDGYLRELAKLDRKPASAVLPAWAEQDAQLAVEARP